jgi:light-regulated signal transduction histidine kinase (bacteriophytochrome)
MFALSDRALVEICCPPISHVPSCAPSKNQTAPHDVLILSEAEDIPRLFESFYPASNAGTVQGTGLGLVLVKQCVHLHGGEITVDGAVSKYSKEVSL